MLSPTFCRIAFLVSFYAIVIRLTSAAHGPEERPHGRLTDWGNDLLWPQTSYQSPMRHPQVVEPSTTYDLSSIRADEYTVLSHPLFPHHSARIKKANFCDPTVNTFTGYIDVGLKHLFFYFFESRNDPAHDDVLLWTNGGPGGSSAVGLLAELGPCNIVSANETEFNPFSWNSNASIFFIDQPAGTGFSYADSGDVVSTAEEGAKDVAAFAAIFFETFPQYKGRPFHLSGESYAGRYLPVYASAIVDQNAHLKAANFTPVNLKSVMIGNGATDFYHLFGSYYKVQCTGVVQPAVQSIQTCVRMSKAVPRCQSAYKAACIDQWDHMACEAAYQFCFRELMGPYRTLGLNPYDLTKRCDDVMSCITGADWIESYLNEPAIRNEIGIDPGFGNYTLMSAAVGVAFAATGDRLYQNQLYVAELLARGIKVLVYAGSYDFICNWLGNEKWTLEMEWFGQKDYVAQSLRNWTIDGEVVGQTRSAHNLTFATVLGGGHTMPKDKPKEALTLINKWIWGQEL